MRVRYPSVIDGAIAASAPVAAFVSRFIDPPFDPAAYWQVRSAGLCAQRVTFMKPCAGPATATLAAGFNRREHAHSASPNPCVRDMAEPNFIFNASFALLVCYMYTGQCRPIAVLP